MTTFLFFCWIFLPLLTLLTTKFSSPAWTLFLTFSQLHSNGFTHTSQTDISPLQSITRLHHHHSSCTVCLRVLLHVYTPSRTLRSSSDTRMLEIHQYKRKTHGFRTFSCFGSHIWNSLTQDLIDTAQPCHLLKPNWKPSSSHSISILTNISTSFCYSPVSYTHLTLPTSVYV